MTRGGARRLPVAVALASALAGCDDLVGLEDRPTPLARVAVAVTGDLDAVRVPEDQAAPARLRAALVWGNQWLIEPFCFLPPESPEAAAVIAAGCRDPFGFAPEIVAATAEVGDDGRSAIELFDLPPADVMVGDVTARMAYGSVLVFDDLDGDEHLRFPRPERDDPDDPDDFDDDFDEGRDRVYGASFVTMTRPDRRIAFREGGFDELAAFYPRRGCEPPPPGFSILDAGGFSRQDAIAAVLLGELPEQDPATCATASLDEAEVEVALVPPAEVRDVGCRVRGQDGDTRYREPPTTAPDYDNQPWGCVGFPSLGDDEPVEGEQFVIATRPEETCVGLTHYILRGCDEEPDCEIPEWDRTESAPDWWPCGVADSR